MPLGCKQIGLDDLFHYLNLKSISFFFFLVFDVWNLQSQGPNKTPRIHNKLPGVKMTLSQLNIKDVIFTFLCNQKSQQYA